MNVKSLSDNTLWMFDMMYTDIASSEYSTQKALYKAVRQAKKSCERIYAPTIAELPQELKAFFSKGCDCMELWAFLQECHAETETRLKESDDRFFEEFAYLPEQDRDALHSLMRWYEFPAFSVVNNDAELILEDDISFRRSLTLQDFHLTGDYDPETEPLLIQQLRKTENGIICDCRVEDWGASDNDARTVRITFSHVHSKLQVFDPGDGTGIFTTPWDVLGSVCSAIVDKADVAAQLCNEQELQILPLVKEIDLLCMGAYRPGSKYEFPLLKELVLSHGCTKAAILLDKAEKKDHNKLAGSSLTARALREMSKAKFEPMWREIWNSVTQTQKQYPKKCETLADQAKLQAVRTKISQTLRANGYEGTYPDFVKKSDIKGLRLANAYDLSYTVGFEKGVCQYIHCGESLVGDDVSIDFLCGTDITKGRICQDVYACLFDDNGRRISNYISFFEDDGEMAGESLMLCLSAVMKCAELKKLSRKEKENFRVLPGSPAKEFFALWHICGALFSIMFCALFFPLVYLIELLSGSGMSFLEFLKLIPFEYIIPFAWNAFGFPVAFLAVYSKRR